MLLIVVMKTRQPPENHSMFRPRKNDCQLQLCKKPVKIFHFFIVVYFHPALFPTKNAAAFFLFRVGLRIGWKRCYRLYPASFCSETTGCCGLVGLTSGGFKCRLFSSWKLGKWSNLDHVLQVGLTVEEMETSRVGLVEKEGDQFIPLKSNRYTRFTRYSITYT